MIEDFFKYLLICGNSTDKAELESDTLPYTFRTMPRKLKNYRIYGNTINGESVGNRTKNLADVNSMLQGYWAYADGTFTNSDTWVCTPKIPCKGNTDYTLSFDNKSRWAGFVWFDNNKNYISTANRNSGFDNGGSFTATSPNEARYLVVDVAGYPDSLSLISKSKLVRLQVEENSERTSYEPYGYKIPVTINEQTTNIYLDRPLANGDYIDYESQKRYNSDGTIESVALPEITVYDGANEISIDTAVQPSKVYLQGNISETEVLSPRHFPLIPLIFNSQSSDNFWKYLLINGKSSDKVKLESTTLPYTFYTLPTLENYRIYGNTVNGESVGKQNIFDKTKANRQYSVVRNADGELVNSLYSNYLDYYMSVEPSTNYIAKGTKSYNLPYIPTRVHFFDIEKNWLGRTDLYPLDEGKPDYILFTTPPSCAFVQVQESNERVININKFMIVKGTSVPKSYIPYGYCCIPIINNNQATEILLNKPLAKSGNYADYIDYQTQKRHNADGTVENVILPELAIYDGENEISVDTNVQPSKVYIKGNVSFFVSGWEDVQKLVRAGLHDKYFAVGDQLVCNKGNAELTWDIIGFDHDTPTDTQYTHSMTLQLHDCLSDTMVYDTREALYYAENGLASGTYNFTVPSGYDEIYGGNKTYQFEIPNDITVGAGSHLVVDWNSTTQANNAKINIYASATSETPVNANPISISEGNAGTSLGTADGNSPNLNFIGNARFGNNNYSESAIRQFLNSDKSAGYVWESKSIFDRPPSWNADTAGFMKDIDSDFLAVVGISNKSTISIDDTTSETSSVTLNDKFFLLSRSEVYGGNEISAVDDGSPYPYYSDYSDLSTAGIGSDTNRVKYRNGTAQVWWLRTPILSNKSVRLANAVGRVASSVANSKYGIVPACCII